MASFLSCRLAGKKAKRHERALEVEAATIPQPGTLTTIPLTLPPKM